MHDWYQRITDSPAFPLSSILDHFVFPRSKKRKYYKKKKKFLTLSLSSRKVVQNIVTKFDSTVTSFALFSRI